MRYLRDRTGPRSSNIAEAGGFFVWHGSSGASVPDYQWHITPTHYLEYPHRHDPTSAISFGVTVLRPKSRGRISLVRSEDANGTDTKEPFTLRIDPAYLTDESDRTTFVRSIQESRELLADSNLQTLLGQEIMPGEKRIDENQIAKSIGLRPQFITTLALARWAHRRLKASSILIFASMASMGFMFAMLRHCHRSSAPTLSPLS
jgi:choline dehydrogenase